MWGQGKVSGVGGAGYPSPRKMNLFSAFQDCIKPERCRAFGALRAHMQSNLVGI